MSKHFGLISNRKSARQYSRRPWASISLAEITGGMGPTCAHGLSDSLSPDSGRNWFQSLFRMAAPKVPQEPLSDIVLPLTFITAIELPKKRFFDFLFSPPFTVFTLRYRLGEEEKSLLLGADPKSEFFDKLLAELPVLNGT